MKMIKRFPVMLRRMWSGGDVQDWIDENLGPDLKRLEELEAENATLRAGMKGDYDLDAWLEFVAEKKAPDCPKCRSRAAEPVEVEARRIYNSWQGMDDWSPWVEGGNSFRQEEARAVARRQLGVKK